MKSLPGGRLWLFGVALSAACNGTVQADICRFGFDEQPVCREGPYTVVIQSTPVSDDERRLDSLEVEYNGKKQTLEISPDTTLIEGDRGYVSFDDINFDGTPDLAVTTSFATANLYMDYWVYDKREGRFSFVGNYEKFRRDTADRTLHTETRINAAEYRRRVYSWDGDTLVEQR